MQLQKLWPLLNRCIDKDVIESYVMEYYIAICSLDICNLECIMPNEISQNEKYHKVSLICGI